MNRQTDRLANNVEITAVYRLDGRYSEIQDAFFLVKKAEHVTKTFELK